MFMLAEVVFITYSDIESVYTKTSNSHQNLFA